MGKAETVQPPGEGEPSYNLFEGPAKMTVIRLRWPLVLICSYLLLYSSGDRLPVALISFLALVYLLSNVALYVVDDRWFVSAYFYAPLVLCDTFALTGALILSGRVGTDFYLTYFLIILLAAVWQDLRTSIVVAVIVTILYGYLFFKTTEVYDPSVYLRFPFLFVCSLFYGYFAQAVRGEKALREQAEIQRWKSVANLAAGVAHEVKNPLAILLQGVGYLSQKVRHHDPNVAMVLNDMKEAVRRADNVVRGLMDFSTTSRLQKTKEDLNALIETSLLLVKNHCDRAHIEVRKDLRQVLPLVQLDRNKVEQVFVNVFMNAIEAMPRGGWLRVRAYTVDAEDNGRKIFAEVENTGPNISESLLRNIFEPFVTTKRGSGGTGLGLAIVRNVMEMHGGKVEIANLPGEGVKMTLTFVTDEPSSPQH